MNASSEHILVVDDDAGLQQLLHRYLTENGFRVGTAEDGAAMEAYLREQQVDLIVLDLMLPGEDGLSLARRLHGRGHPPIIMVSARGEDVDRIVGLEMGADDYLAKPFNPRELLARIRAVLRRAGASSTPEPKQQAGTYCFGPFCLDVRSHRLAREGEEIPLTAGEFALLRVLVENPHHVLSRDALLEKTKGYERSPYDRSIDVKVTRLRRKLEDDPARPAYIRTVWGEGYLFSPDG